MKDTQALSVFPGPTPGTPSAQAAQAALVLTFARPAWCCARCWQWSSCGRRHRGVPGRRPAGLGHPAGRGHGRRVTQPRWPGCWWHAWALRVLERAAPGAIWRASAGGRWRACMVASCWCFHSCCQQALGQRRCRCLLARCHGGGVGHARPAPAACTGQTRLAELQSRIRPHFLFNTLNSAIALVRAEPAGRGLAGRLERLFRRRSRTVASR